LLPRNTHVATQLVAQTPPFPQNPISTIIFPNPLCSSNWRHGLPPPDHSPIASWGGGWRH
jgi:hypothetical protein